ncbi:apolipoprotein N-acyltransferase [Gilvimarinus sp. F26214L]|uniref:apolipoprotein N-acyltransferase n=1 Tax=Gilvimarinus sp. DZF01 TaxID=3461371 RepID=UPI00404638E0
MSFFSALRTIRWQWPLLALLAGALVPLSFAPFDIWPIALPCLTVFALLLWRSDARQAFGRSLAFGLGLFGTGASWVFVSIHDFGNASPPFAVLLTVLLVAVLATVFALPFLVLGRWLSRSPLALLVALPALWVIGEWLRSWLFSGFPWLYLGYGHLNTWLAGWAPVIGVMGLSYLVALAGTGIAFAWMERKRRAFAVIPLVLALGLWGAGLPLSKVEWTESYREPLNVGLVQGNIPQDKKWDPAWLETTLSRYFTMSESLWPDSDWVVWPEAAMPLLYHQALPFIDELRSRALQHDAALITGVLYDSREDRAYYNSIVGLGLGSGIYHKQRLVPFGDYVPLRDWFGPILSIFDLPMSVLEPGPPDQKGLQVSDALIAPSICYEIAYPDVVANGAAESHILITVSNDAWFGASLGPLQHMQIAQMRALETGRYLIRATNNGVSALVDSRGRIIARTEQFVQQTLQGEVELRRGETPFMRWGTEPLVVLCLLLVAAAFPFARRGFNRPPAGR